MEPLFPVALDLDTATADEIDAYITEAREVASAIRENPTSYLTEGRTPADLIGEMEAAVENIAAAQAALDALTTEPDTAAVETVEATEDELAALDALAAQATTVPETVEADALEDAVEETAVEPETVVAAAPAARPARGRLPRPTPDREARQAEERNMISLVAAAANLGHDIGEEVDFDEAARMMHQKLRSMGHVPEGVSGEKLSVVRADWSDRYPEELRLSKDAQSNMALVAAAVDQKRIRDEMDRRKRLDGPESLTASGGLCAPRTPLYDLPILATAARPVRDSLPSFNASRGGIQFARPASLGNVSSAIGTITATQDSIGGTTGSKPCLRIACPPFVTVDVQAISRCLEAGNLTTRAFPELLAQWSTLVLAYHAKVAESELLTSIAVASTDVSALDRALGASAELPSQLMAQAAGLRSRHRMAADAPMDVLLPSWVPDLIVSDTYRRQFGQYDLTKERFVSVLRQANIEPTFYLDQENNGAQVFGTQSAGTMLGFPNLVRWYMFPPGSFLFLDGGSLDLGLVRDSVLNETNDFQVFGETWEAVAFVGVESIAGASSISDCGATAATATTTCG